MDFLIFAKSKKLTKFCEISFNKYFCFRKKFCKNVGIPNIFRKNNNENVRFGQYFQENLKFSWNVGIPNILAEKLTKISFLKTYLHKFSQNLEFLHKIQILNIVMSWLSCPGYL
jgi:hypothetical protein